DGRVSKDPRRLHRANPQGGAPGGPAGGAASHLRAGDQPEDRQGARHRCAALAARPRRRGDRMRRREFFGLLAGSLASGPFIALAQVPPKRRLVAVIIASSRADSERCRKGLPQGLQELGYVESRDYEIEYRYADGDLTRQPALANELIQLKPSVIVVGNSAAAIAAKQATATIPIVAAATFDPVSIGLAASHARPEGNVTGLVAGLDTVIGILHENFRRAAAYVDKIFKGAK